VVGEVPYAECDDGQVEWRIIIQGSRRDIERLLGQSFEQLSGTEDPSEASLAITDGHDDLPTDESRQTAKVLIDAAVRHLNGFGALRWGRAFEGIAIKRVCYLDSSGVVAGQVVFVGTVYDHMPPEEYADLMERLGRPRPDSPPGIDDINTLDLSTVAALSTKHPQVARVLRHVELMLVGDDQIDWAAGYSALELIEKDTHRHGVSGRQLGLWTRKELQQFNQMANSFEAVGTRSRHPGLDNKPPKKLLSPKEGAWIVRRAAARRIAWRLIAERTSD
jgi:hypothetical protein